MDELRVAGPCDPAAGPRAVGPGPEGRSPPGGRAGAEWPEGRSQKPATGNTACSQVDRSLQPRLTPHDEIRDR